MKINKMILVASFGVALLAISCNNKPKNIDKEVVASEKQSIENIVPLSVEKGKNVLQMHCFSCHNPKSESHDNMLAPPLAGIKYKYKNLYSDRAEFIAKMSDFVFEPTKDNAVMKGPVKRFGLMPKTTLMSKEEVFEVVAFIYDNEMDVPQWFPEHFEDQHGKAWSER